MEKTTQKENKNRDLYSVQYSSLEKDTIKHVKLRVYLLDNEFKTIYIEADSKVVNVLEILSIKMGIEDIENFGIFEQWENNGKLEEKLLKNEDPLPGSKARKSERKLILKCKLFRELNIINSNEQSAHLYYIQTKSNILTGYFYTDINNAVSLAAIQMQIEFGTYCPEKHKLGFMQTRIRDFVCNRLLEIKGGKHMEGLILQAFSQRDPKTLVLLKKYYVLEAMKSAVFGCRFFAARQKKSKALPDHILIGVNSNGIVVVRSDTKEFLRQWKFEDLFRWGHTDTAFYMQLKSMKDSHAGSIWELFSNEGENICELLNLYQNCILDDLENLPHKSVYSEDIAVIKIQAHWRGYLLRKSLKVIEKIMACNIIAKAWMSYN